MIAYLYFYLLKHKQNHTFLRNAVYLVCIYLFSSFFQKILYVLQIPLLYVLSTCFHISFNVFLQSRLSTIHAYIWILWIVTEAHFVFRKKSFGFATIALIVLVVVGFIFYNPGENYCANLLPEYERSVDQVKQVDLTKYEDLLIGKSGALSLTWIRHLECHKTVDELTAFSRIVRGNYQYIYHRK